MLGGTQEAGDLIVIPCGWMHEVTTMEVDPSTGRSVSYSVMLSSRADIPSVIMQVAAFKEPLQFPSGCSERGKGQKIAMLNRLADPLCTDKGAIAVIEDVTYARWDLHL